jgi:protocatechuate 3,4-dioxygenase beta subunit
MEAPMSDTNMLSHRQLITLSLVVVGSIVLSTHYNYLSAQPPIKPTPEQVTGPFYPAMKPPDQDADLTVIQGKPGKAKGQVIHLMGRVLNLKGEPIPGARVEIWQANTYGRYTHPGDTNPAPLDPNFEGYGVQTTDAEGRYRFKTIKPGAYPAAQGWTRPPHIHFSVTTKTNHLITQLYFAGEPLNEKDELLTERVDKNSLILKLMPPTKDVEPDSLIAVWDIVLSQK